MSISVQQLKIIRVEAEKEFEVVGNLFRAYQKELGKDLSFQGFDEELQSLKTRYNEANGAILILKDLEDEEYVGCIGVKRLDDRKCELKRLYVKPDYRAKKYGFLLVHAILEIAIELGYQEMWLDTLKELEPALRLYKKLGFVETEAYYDNPYDDVVYMRKELV